MKPIKITESNAGKIETALRAVNGKAYEHTYTEFEEIDYLAKLGERLLTDASLPLKIRAGAKVFCVSGEKVSNSYSRKGYKRAATRMTMVRHSKDWFVSDLGRTEVFQDGGDYQLFLTEQQHEHALRAAQYWRVLP